MIDCCRTFTGLGSGRRSLMASPSFLPLSSLLFLRIVQA